MVLAKGYGVRKLGEPTPVDEETLFAIASCSKAFTTAALAMLVDEGKIDWDDPVIDHLPGFRLHDPYVTGEITIRDLVTHRSGLGLGGGDLLWLRSDYTRDEIVQRIRFLEPTSSLRSRFAYQNVMFLVAGQVIPAVTGKSWDEFIAERIFEPLRMRSANTSVTGLEPGGNWATPHLPVGEQVRAIAYDNVDNVGPAGSINASVADLTKWLRLQLSLGRIGEKRLYSEEAAREMWSPQTIIPIQDPPPPLAALKPTFSAYGLGWGLRDYRGRKLVSHTGGLAGMTSMTTLVPSETLGIVVLTNQETSLYAALTYRILDAYLGVPATDWTAAHLEARKLRERKAAEEVAAIQAKRVQETAPSLPLSSYTGDYRDAMYGDATIEEQDGGLRLRFTKSPPFQAQLEHWHYDTFVARWGHHSIPDAFVTFSLNPDGSIAEFKMKALSPLADFSYDYQDLLFRPVPSSETPRHQ
ncbi:MAG: serine hydrolase [Acidobacteriota bacterium]